MATPKQVPDKPGKPPAVTAKKPPQSVGTLGKLVPLEDLEAFRPPDEIIIARLTDEIFALWRANQVNRYKLGKKLFLLQQELRKPGYGTWLVRLREILAEVDMSQATAYRLMAYYERVEEILAKQPETDVAPFRLSQRDKDEAEAKFPVEFVNFDPAALEKAAADVKARKVKDACKQADKEAEVARRKARGRIPPYHVKLQLNKKQLKKFKKAFFELGAKKASLIIYEAIIRAKTTHHKRPK